MSINRNPSGSLSITSRFLTAAVFCWLSPAVCGAVEPIPANILFTYYKLFPFQENELPHVEKEHSVEIGANCLEYNIPLGGTVDMDHATTREAWNWYIGWQPNVSLTIENIGAVSCENANIIVNGRGDWYTIEGIIDDAVGSAANDQEKVFSIWEFVRANKHNESPTHRRGPSALELHDPPKMLMSHQSGHCGYYSVIAAKLFNRAGFDDPPPRMRHLQGHVNSEVFAAGRWQFLDTTGETFYLDRENECPSSGDDVARDHDLGHRELFGGPIFKGYHAPYAGMAKFGRDDGTSKIDFRCSQIRVNLRPGERIEYRWDNVGKWASETPGLKRRFVGNSRKIYEPRLDAEKAGAMEAKNVSTVRLEGRPAVAGTDAQGELLYRMHSDFAVCGGHITAAFQLADAADRAVIEAGVDPEKLKKVWESDGPGEKTADLEIDDAIQPDHSPVKHDFYVRVRLASAADSKGAVLEKLALRADVMVYPIALPRLRLGDNRIVYSDDSQPGRKVRVTYKWKETDEPLPPPPEMVYPANGATLRDAIVTYRWKPVEGAKRYHIQVSRDPQMRWPYRPCLDVIYGPEMNEHTVRFWGIYSPDVTYRWRVRAQNQKGIWSDWSKVRTFRWDGPRIPVNVRVDRRDEAFVLKWEANPRGPRAVSYEVYGSDIKGFSIHKEPYTYPNDFGWIADHGPMPSNYLGRTTGNELVVGGAATVEQTPAGVENSDNLNRCYYRVVAFNAHGTPGGCSYYAELPHPCIWTRPPTTARAGKPYRYQARCITSQGDLQYRGDGKPTLIDFWEREIPIFSLLFAPPWLSVDAKSGLVMGTPPADAKGAFPVRLGVTPTVGPLASNPVKAEAAQRFDEQSFTVAIED